MEKKVKIGIDASRYKIDQPTGVEWYSYHLLNKLIPLMGTDHHIEFILYSNGKLELDQENCGDLPFNVKNKAIPFPRFWSLFRLSWEMFWKGPDKLFIPSHILPLWLPKETIVTVHDIAFKIPSLKAAYSWKERLLLEWSTKRAVKKAAQIIVPSQATKDDLIKYYQCKAEKITVIYHGAPELTGANNPLLMKWNEEEKKEIFDLVRIKEGDLYALYVGRLEFKKNLGNLIDGFARFLTEYPGWKLVLAGKRGVGFEAIWKKVVDLGLQESVLMPGYITEREKYYLLDKCRIFAYPSYYEGFGLPILEAFAFRRPVLTSKISSMPEVAGKAACFVNPNEVAEISVGLKRLASDGMMISKLIAEGEIQLQKFDWEKAARETLKTLIS